MTLSCTTPDDVIRAIKDDGVQMVDLRFTDTFGMWHHTSFPPSTLDAAAIAEGLGFDGSAIPSPDNSLGSGRAWAAGDAGRAEPWREPRDDRGWWVAREGLGRGTLPRGSGRLCGPRREQRKAGAVGIAGRQRELDPGRQLGDPAGHLDQHEAERVELGVAPERPLRG
jgi:glutamine synthetase-like protein